MAVQTPAGNTASQFYSDFVVVCFAHKPQAFAITTARFLDRPYCLFEDTMDISSGKAAACAVSLY
jgi:hypothetical protein